MITLKSFDKTKLYPPCQVGCPIFTDIPKYIKLVALDRLKEAEEVIREVNPLPRVLGRVCHHPCEEKCRRREIDSALDCASLKRFITDHSSYQNIKPAQIKYQERVAIIGAGPAGLAAGYELALLGYKATIFEKEALPGGMLVFGIPKYRLPKGVVEADIEFIKNLGVEIRTNQEIRDSNSLVSLFKEYQAVIIATGLPLSKTLNIPGASNQGVLLALPFLRNLNLGVEVKLGQKVIVIGGGNVAIDCARASKRLGAEVKLMCLEAREEMPAFPWEIEEAEREGIKLECRVGPKRVLEKGGKIQGIETVAVKAVFNEKGEFAPTFYEDKLSFIEGDTVIIAIGQEPEVSFFKETQIEVKPHSLTTNRENVFVCGDIIHGPTSVVEAIASGKEAALAVHQFFTQESFPKIEIEEVPSLPKLHSETVKLMKKLDRVELPTLPLAERERNFKEVNLGFTEKEMRAESKRCLNCGQGPEWIEEKCALCLTCIRVCPLEVLKLKESKIEVDIEQCQTCGTCQAQCPAKAIVLREKLDWLSEALKHLLMTGVKEIEFWCAYLPLETQGNSKSRLRIPCLVKLEPIYILRAYELGVEKLSVVRCGGEECKFKEVPPIVNRMLEYSKEILKESGISEDRFKLIERS